MTSNTMKALESHAEQMAEVHLRELFLTDSTRFTKFSQESCGLLLDFSKQRITDETLNLLVEFAESKELNKHIESMFSGESINHTENRAALHTALRNQSGRPVQVNGEDVMPGVNDVLNRLSAFSHRVRDGEWLGHSGKPIDTIVNIGIGGSDLGPKMVTMALKAFHHERLQAHFVSNLDALHLSEILDILDPETTLFIIASKTFTTQETLTNAHTARTWFLQHNGDESAIAKHFVAVSTNHEKVAEFGIDTANMFEFWDWVGGRYSLWSAIGLPIMLMIGPEAFRQLLAGAHSMDEHFRTAPFMQNLPVLLGLLGVWNNTFLKLSTYAVLPYDYALRELPAYLQQLEMESNGKQVTREGATAPTSSCPILWGAPGNNGQHAFFQLMHQGTQPIPADFIVAMRSQSTVEHHQNAVLANALAQTRALMLGRTAEETRTELEAAGVSGTALEMQIPHRTFPGNRPTNTLLYDKLTPHILGALLALYDHKVFTQSVCWQVNPFDQWGVELGKQMASDLLPALQGKLHTDTFDASTT
ncbi:MAG: glucose-6-phosphate isomerase, partial [Pseudomonadota bacterium]